MAASGVTGHSGVMLLGDKIVGPRRITVLDIFGDVYGSCLRNAVQSATIGLRLMSGHYAIMCPCCVAPDVADDSNQTLWLGNKMLIVPAGTMVAREVP
jgi:hypothetical protein